MGRLIYVWAIAALLFAGACASDDSGGGGGGTADAGSDARGTTDTGVRQDTGSPGTDTGVRDTGQPPVDTGQPPEDTGTPQDTSPPEDTSRPLDTSPPEDTAPPQDTTPQDTAVDTAADTTPDVAPDIALDTTVDTAVDTGDVGPGGTGASCDDPLNLLDFEVEENAWLHAGGVDDAPLFPAAPGDLYTPTCTLSEDSRPDDPAEVVYEFVAPVTGLYWVTTLVTLEDFDSVPDTIVYMLNSACTEELACNDDFFIQLFTGFLSEFYVTLTAGTTYYIVVEPWDAGDNGGPYGLEVVLMDTADPACGYYDDPTDVCAGFDDSQACLGDTCTAFTAPTITDITSEVEEDYDVVADDPFCIFDDEGDTVHRLTFTFTVTDAHEQLMWSFFSDDPTLEDFVGLFILDQWIDGGAFPEAGEATATASFCFTDDADGLAAIAAIEDAGEISFSVLNGLVVDLLAEELVDVFEGYHPGVIWIWDLIDLNEPPTPDDLEDDTLIIFAGGVESAEFGYDVPE